MPYEGLWYILGLSIFVEAVTEAFKSLSPRVHGLGSRLLAFFIGIVVCVASRVGIVGLLGLSIRYPMIDYVLTGIIISRGSNIVHDMVTKLRSIKPQQQS